MSGRFPLAGSVCRWRRNPSHFPARAGTHPGRASRRDGFCRLDPAGPAIRGRPVYGRADPITITQGVRVGPKSAPGRRLSAYEHRWKAALNVMSELAAYCEDLARRARSAARTLATAPETQKNQWLEKTAAALDSHADEILRANQRDLAAAWSSGLSSAQIDRLQLSTDRLQTAATGLREIAALPDPVARVLDTSLRPNGLRLQK